MPVIFDTVGGMLFPEDPDSSQLDQDIQGVDDPSEPSDPLRAGACAQGLGCDHPPVEIVDGILHAGVVWVSVYEAPDLLELGLVFAVKDLGSFWVSPKPPVPCMQGAVRGYPVTVTGAAGDSAW